MLLRLAKCDVAPAVFYLILINELCWCRIWDRTTNRKPPRIGNTNNRLLPSIPVGPEEEMTCEQIIDNRGYPVETRKVKTHDGYVLKLHRIPYGKNASIANTPYKRKPILMLSGFAGSCADFVVTPSNRSLAFRLADVGYDVWLGNFRGNDYSRTHANQSLSQEEYWNFSWDEMGHYDIPAFINIILGTTGFKQLIYIGYSMGTTSFFVAMTYYPHLNNKIEAMMAMAPVASVTYDRGTFVTSGSALSKTPIWPLYKWRYQNRPYADVKLPMTGLLRHFCSRLYMTFKLCMKLSFLPIGFDPANWDQSLTPSIFSHTPAGTSFRTLDHFVQNKKGLPISKFRKYNFGRRENLKRYGQATPPAYALSEVTAPVYLFSSLNDVLANPLDVSWLKRELSNVKESVTVNDATFNHADFLWGLNANHLVYNQLISSLPETNMPLPEIHMTVDEIIDNRGYPVEMHFVTTSDGYILQLQRIPYGRKSKPASNKPVVYLQHGLLTSAADWIIGNVDRALGYVLADAGYDVWLGGVRGDTYCRNHTTLDPDHDTEFWHFSFDEIGQIDVPAQLNYVLQTIGQPTLSYVGHSQGTLTFFIAMETHPELQSKINQMFALTPVSRIANTRSPIRILASFANSAELIADLFGRGELLPSRYFYDLVGKELCYGTSKFIELCENYIFLIGGPNHKDIDTDLIPLVMSNFPAGTSVQNFAHYLQQYRTGKYERYDYGSKINFQRYGQHHPPEYDLTKVKVPIMTFWGDNDWLADPLDVNWAEEKFPSLLREVRNTEYNHFDFLWATNVRTVVNDVIVANLPIKP